jgi:hypothetical protein
MAMDIRVPEAIVSLPVPRNEVPPVRHVRGQWIASSLRAVRERGLMDSYLSKLPPEHHLAIRSTPVHEWLPANVVVAHYAALDALYLPIDDILSIGSTVVIHSHGKAIQVVLRLIPTSVFNVFSVLAKVDRLWNRAFDGGAPAVFRLGPKEARIDVVGLPFSHLRYPRLAIRGVITGVMRLLVKTVYVNDVTPSANGNVLSYSISWV